MKRQDALKKLEKILEPEFASMEHNTIVPDGDDYIVFGCYRISKNRVYKYTTAIGEFASHRVALSWCIADKFQQHRLAQDLLDLEQVVSVMAADVKTRQHLARSLKRPDYRENVAIKLDRKKQQLRAAQEQLDKCVNLAKYYQIRGFNNETARTGRQPSYRTSR